LTGFIANLRAGRFLQLITGAWRKEVWFKILGKLIVSDFVAQIGPLPLLMDWAQMLLPFWDIEKTE
jgi:hypothetical protein